MTEPVLCGELHLDGATGTVVTGWVVLGDDREAVSLRVQLTADDSRFLARLQRGHWRVTLEPVDDTAVPGPEQHFQPAVQPRDGDG